MAYHFVNGGAHTLRVSFIVQRCRNSSHFHRHFMDYIINLLGTHARTDHFCHCIQNCHIDYAAVLNSLDLLLCFQDTPARYNMSFQFIMMNFLIKSHMTGLIFFAASTPTGIISSNFLHLHRSFPFTVSGCFPLKRPPGIC